MRSRRSFSQTGSEYHRHGCKLSVLKFKGRNRPQPYSEKKQTHQRNDSGQYHDNKKRNKVQHVSRASTIPSDDHITITESMHGSIVMEKESPTANRPRNQPIACPPIQSKILTHVSDTPDYCDRKLITPICSPLSLNLQHHRSNQQLN